MGDSLRKGLEKAAIDGARKHLFLCIGPDCVKPRIGELTWEYVKQRTKECPIPVMRTKAACFRICTDGPWLVIYPDGIWYSNVTPNRFERILQQHIIGGVPVTEWIVAHNALSPQP
jgi:(2Fe-2S) ferredoxin